VQMHRRESSRSRFRDLARSVMQTNLQPAQEQVSVLVFVGCQAETLCYDLNDSPQKREF
jgi:hypothetical protein